MADFFYVLGDTKDLRAELMIQSSTGMSAVDLTGTTVQAKIWRAGEPAGVQTLAGAVVNASTGLVQTVLSPSVPLSPGTYFIRWVVEFADMTQRTFPESSPLAIQVSARAS